MSDEERPDGHAQDTELKDSNPNAAGPERAAGGIGISSERVGPTGPGQESTDGERDTRQAGTSGDPDSPTTTHRPNRAPATPSPSPKASNRGRTTRRRTPAAD